MNELQHSAEVSSPNKCQTGLDKQDDGISKYNLVIDQEFNPSVEMMVNDFDDERTLDEEEALEVTEDPATELSNLQREGDMPLEELLAMYGYGEQCAGGGEGPSSNSSSEEGGTGLRELYTSPQQAVAPREEEDGDYSPPDDEDWRKTIMVGADYQAGIPEGLCRYGDALPYENEDKLLWEPGKLGEREVEEFLVRAQEPLVNNNSVGAIPTGSHTRDDEQALYLLLQCGYNVEEALRRRRMNVIPPTDTMSLWSEEECRNFENGLRSYGKDFHLIQQNKVRTRSVGELVQFYYLWKKTERHDIFANKARLEKKKYTLHPGITDYMDRFLEEQETGSGNRDRSSSPNINCLIYGDPKRQLRGDVLSEADRDSLESEIGVPQQLGSVEVAFASTTGGQSEGGGNTGEVATSAAVPESIA